MKKLIGAVVAVAIASGLYAQAAEVPSDTQVLAGRTNVHSDGRAGGKALPRRGSQRPSFGTGSIHKVSFETPMSVEIMLPERIYGPYSPPVKPRFGRGKPSTPKHPIGKR